MNPQQTKQKVAELIEKRKIIFSKYIDDDINNEDYFNQMNINNIELCKIKTDLEAWLEKFEECRKEFKQKYGSGILKTNCGNWICKIQRFCPSCQAEKQQRKEILKQIEEILK